MNCLVGGPLLVGGLGPGPLGPPLNPALVCTHSQHPWSQKVSGRNVGVSQRNTVLNRNRRLLLWWSQQNKDKTKVDIVNDVNLQFTNECFLNNITNYKIAHCITALYSFNVELVS